MKGSRLFVSVIVALLALTFAIDYNMPQKFVWTPTFAHHDDQPLGCQLFDSLLAASIPGKYSLSNKTLYQLNEEDSVSRRAILIIADDLEYTFTKLDVATMLRMAERGCRFLLVSRDYNYTMKDTLSIHIDYYSALNMDNLKRYGAKILKKDTVFWIADSVYPARNYPVYSQFVGSGIYVSKKNALPVRYIAESGGVEVDTDNANEDDSTKVPTAGLYRPTIALARPWGKGEIILSASPYLFSNYGVLEGNVSEYVFRLLSQLDGLPITRTEAYVEQTAETERSPLRGLLEHPPLRWALYLTTLTILLFMFFTARRRQRAIPVIRPPQNRSLEFIELIGTLYYQRKKPDDLVRKKFTYFAETLRREAQVDVEEATEDERTFARLARKSGMEQEGIATLVRQVRLVVYGGRTVNDEQMKRCIDGMNEIVKKLTS
ncbi:MAG: DUF4350 domain-containing protein [Mediterranea sp.]|jgi:hypothetical protein|nr:DUF4350 domain-containing protein [Mediterranea sp.]